MIYLLDTNVWVKFLRQSHPAIVARMQAHQPAEIRTCSVVAAELYFGCLRSAQPEANRAKVDAALEPYVCLPFDSAAAEIQAQVRHSLEKQGTPIGPYDLQIASIALANGCTLVTHNVSEFSRVSGLQIEDWEIA